MRLVCPSCAAEYEVPDEAVPEEGRDVQCGTCSTSWFQERPPVAQPAPEAPVAEPLEEIPQAPVDPVIAEDLPGEDISFPDDDFETPYAAGEAASAPEPEQDSLDVAEAGTPEPEAVVAPEPEQRRPEPVAVPEPEQRRPEPVVEPEPEQRRPEPLVEPEPEQRRPEPVAEPEPVVEQPPATQEAPAEEPQPGAEDEPEPVAQTGAEAKAEPGKTPRPSSDLDFDFDFDFEDDEPAAAAKPEPVAEETTQVRRFDTSLHSKPAEDRSASPSWAKEVPQTAKPPRPEPEDLSAPEETAKSDEEDDLLAAVRGELDKIDERPERREEGSDSALTGKRMGVAAAAEASGIVFDEEFEDDDFGFSAEDLGDTLQQDALEDLSAPEPKGRGPQFSIGFATVSILFALAYAAYLLGPNISRSFPSAAPYLTSYVNTVDQTRRIVEELSGNALGFAEDKINENDGS